MFFFAAYCCFHFRSFAFSFLRHLLLSGFALKAVRLLMRQTAGWSSACAILKDAPKTGSKVNTFVMAQACQNVLVLSTYSSSPAPPPSYTHTETDLLNQFVSHDMVPSYRTIKMIYEPNEVVRKCVCMQQNSKSILFFFWSFFGNLFWFLFKWSWLRWLISFVW